MPKVYVIGGILNNLLIEDPVFDVYEYRWDTYYRDEIDPFYVLKGYKPTPSDIRRKNQILGYARRSIKPAFSNPATPAPAPRLLG